MSNNYLVSARKYRPMTFDSVVGQSALTTTLKNSIASGRLAHAYLFCGPRGVGKTTCARIFAKTINCLHPKPNGDACEECESCRAFNEQRSFNIHELDAASNNGVDDIRQLIEQVNIPPQIGKYKVFIIDEVHMLSTSAFNAFLKTLEEPPAHAIFILATTEKHKLLPTILSRCQIYDFNRMTIQDIVGHLEKVAQQENIAYEPAALNVIAQKADGGMRDALSIFDQVASFCQGNITYQQTIADLNVLDYEYYFKLVDYFLGGNIPAIMLTFNDILSKGFEGSHFIGGLNEHLRNLLVSRDEQTTKLIEASDEVRKRYAGQARRCQPKFLYAAIRKCTDCDLNYRASQNKRLLVELTLIEIEQLAADDGAGSGPGPTRILKPIFPKGQEHSASAPSLATAQAADTQASPRPAQPSAPRATQPASRSAAAAAHATPQRGTANTAKGFSISLSRGQDAPSPPAPATPSGTDTAPAPDAGKPQMTLSQQTLMIAWKTFAASLPLEQKAMATRMENIQPALLADRQHFEIVVDNPIVEKQFREFSSQLLPYLRQQLQAPGLDMLLRLRQDTDKPAVYSKREQYKYLCDENETLMRLSETFGLELTN